VDDVNRMLPQDLCQTTNRRPARGPSGGQYDEVNIAWNIGSHLLGQHWWAHEAKAKVASVQSLEKGENMFFHATTNGRVGDLKYRDKTSLHYRTPAV
jgi:hypothetical protein